MDELDMFGGLDAPVTDAAVMDRPAASAVEAAKLGLEAAHAALEAAVEHVSLAQEKSDQDLSGWMRAAASETLTQNQRTRDRAVADVEKAASRLAQEEAAATSGCVTTGGNPESGVSGAGEPPALVYDTAEEFLHQHLLPLYNRPLDARNGKWCPKWYLHAEAVSRMDSLWRAWEHLRLDPATGLSVWWKDHADVHMAVLLNQRGPFYACSATRHNTPEPFPCEIAPDGWFPKASETPDV